MYLVKGTAGIPGKSTASVPNCICLTQHYLANSGRGSCHCGVVRPDCNIMATLSFDELLRVYELTVEECDRVVSDEEIGEISSQLCGKFRELTHYLPGMKEIHVNDIDRDKYSEEEKRVAFFKKWKDVMGLHATYKALVNALLKIRCGKDAEEVCKRCKASIAAAHATKTPSGK